MTVEHTFCIEKLVASCGSERPDDLWLEYQASIPANTSQSDLTDIKTRFYTATASLLDYEELPHE